MNNVEFEENIHLASASAVRKSELEKESFFTRLLIRLKIVSNSSQANMVMVGLTIFFFLLAGTLLFSATGAGKEQMSAIERYGQVDQSKIFQQQSQIKP